MTDHGNGELVHPLQCTANGGARAGGSITRVAVADDAVGWFARHARDLPWRAPGTGAWPILISEVMLQQTPAARVAPVWRAWIARWPAPADLAAAPAAEAIRAWGRLGYPRRALRLHECAQVLAARHGGQVPRSVPELEALPGVGAYTARAVAAFAYRQRHPVVDTNVRRLVARCVGGEPDAGATTSGADLTATAGMLPEEPERAAVASAALMELGALVCTARAPRCDACPLAGHCAWLARGAALPAGPTRRPQRYAGTDRQVRGVLLAVLREEPAPVSRTRLDAVWPDAAQRDRALASLVADGLVHERRDGRFALAQDTRPAASP